MNTSQIMALADAYAASVVAHGADKRDEARAALEAALTEKQEPVAWMSESGWVTASKHVMQNGVSHGITFTPLHK